MSTEHDIADTLDVTGLNCPMPILKTKQAIDGMANGEVLEVLATDPGSVPDVDGWAASTPTVELLAQSEAEADGRTVYTHLVRKVPG